MSKTLNTNIKI